MGRVERAICAGERAREGDPRAAADARGDGGEAFDALRGGGGEG